MGFIFIIYAVMLAIASGKASQTLIFAARSSGILFGKAVTPFPRAAVCRLFSAVPAEQDTKKASKKSFWSELVSRPVTSYFSNPEIETDWEVREEEDTGVKFYFNKVTQDKVLVHPVLKRASVFRRIGAGIIDIGVSFGTDFLFVFYTSWCESCLFPVDIGTGRSKSGI